MRGHPLLFSLISVSFYQLFGSPLDPGLSRWLSLAELPGEGEGSLPSLFSFLFDLFVNCLGPPFPLAGSGSRSLSSQREPFLLRICLSLTDLSIIWADT